MSEWISVEDRLPPDDKQCYYLVRNRGGDFDISFWYAWEQEPGDWLGVTHWIPLPDQPKRITND